MRSRFAILVVAVAVVVVEGVRHPVTDFLQDKQVYLSKKERFIKFDTKDDEVEIELGVSVPVVKIPLAPEVARKEESAITVSAPGLVVAGVLMFTTYLLIPLLFATHKIDRSDGSEHGTQLRSDARDSLNCIESLICWTSKTETLGKLIDDVSRAPLMEGLIKGTVVGDAIATGRRGLSCSEKYPNCPIVKKVKTRTSSSSTHKPQ